MDKSFMDHNNEEEEYILLDLSDVCGQVDIPPEAPYVLSGLDTLNPILTIDDKLKLIGEYEETVGTCLLFSENERAPVVHKETGPSETNPFEDVCIVNPSQPSNKQIRPVASLHKILKFKLLSEADPQGSTEKPADLSV
ncbi:hypothetical protein Ancab_021397 [Ancistrocladus abbreviatus]